MPEGAHEDAKSRDRDEGPHEERCLGADQLIHATGGRQGGSFHVLPSEKVEHGSRDDEYPDRHLHGEEVTSSQSRTGRQQSSKPSGSPIGQHDERDRCQGDQHGGPGDGSEHVERADEEHGRNDVIANADGRSVIGSQADDQRRPPHRIDNGQKSPDGSGAGDGWDRRGRDGRSESEATDDHDDGTKPPRCRPSFVEVGDREEQ